MTRIKKRDYAQEVGLIICQDFYNEHLIEPLENLGEQLLDKFGLHLKTSEPSYCDSDYYEDEQIAQVFCDVEYSLTHPEQEKYDNYDENDDFSVYDAWTMWYDEKLNVDVVDPISQCDFSVFENLDWGEIGFLIMWDILQVRQDYNVPGKPWFYHHRDSVNFGANYYC